MDDIKPIETEYKGYRFRSRLEARWAVFFQTAGIPWEYEPEGIDLDADGGYLPDFLIRVEFIGVMGEHIYRDLWNDTFIEVKPYALVPKQADRLFTIARHTSYVLCSDPPGAHRLWHMFPTDDEDSCAEAALFYDLGDSVAICLMPSMGEAYKTAYGLHQAYFNSNKLGSAYLAARQSRFEHGQFGPPSDWGRS